MKDKTKLSCGHESEALVLIPFTHKRGAFCYQCNAWVAQIPQTAKTEHTQWQILADEAIRDAQEWKHTARRLARDNAAMLEALELLTNAVDHGSSEAIKVCTHNARAAITQAKGL